jgi:hypothetical protein
MEDSSKEYVDPPHQELPREDNYLHSPINGIKQLVTRVVSDVDVTYSDAKGARFVDENEYFQLWDNGLMVRKTRGAIQSCPPPVEMPMAQWPDPPYIIPKGK